MESVDSLGVVRGMLHLVGIFLQCLWENVASQVEIIVSHRENIPFEWRNIGENLTSQAFVTFDCGASARENVHTQVRAQERKIDPESKNECCACLRV